MTPKAQYKKKKMFFTKMKHTCSVKDPIKRMKRQATYKEKILPNHLSDKGLITKICKELLKLIMKKAVQLENGLET